MRGKKEFKGFKHKAAKYIYFLKVKGSEYFLNALYVLRTFTFDFTCALRTKKC